MNRKLFIAVICSFILVAGLGISYLLGYRSTIVIHDSMEPTIPKWSLVVLKTKNIHPEKYDIIQFHVSDHYTPVVHRIVKADVKDGTFKTQGDANPIEDAQALTVKQINGVYVMHIPVLGKVLFWIQQYKMILMAGMVIFMSTLGLSLLKKEKVVPNEA
ncbi:signal peptidase I [Niallia taxi]|uniref:signal peptidase I n=1 Tax=Niallia taxi TaxID=2499688 RepID=UPI0020404196|nr:signal peptidase I [Niallia taxi]MCM3212929.1 signal peptidase I [Niallia taxi]